MQNCDQEVAEQNQPTATRVPSQQQHHNCPAALFSDTTQARSFVAPAVSTSRTRCSTTEAKAFYGGILEGAVEGHICFSTHHSSPLLHRPDTCRGAATLTPAVCFVLLPRPFHSMTTPQPPEKAHNVVGFSHVRAFEMDTISQETTPARHPKCRRLFSNSRQV